MEDTFSSPRHVAIMWHGHMMAMQSGLYSQIALYAAGNALSLAAFLLLYNVSAVLADFRDPMLYALLCSIALRGPKDWLVRNAETHLSQQHNLFKSLFTACASPFVAIAWLWHEAHKAATAFNLKVKEIENEYQRKTVN